MRIDAFGNVHARPSTLLWDTPAWLCGSHIDTVPHGGDYDGVAGIVVALEILRADPSVPVELIIFAEEEGPTFGLGMMGSRGWVGELTDEQLTNLRNKSGQNYLEAGAPHGVDPAHFARDRINPAHYHGLIEVHIEQGPGMWKNDQPIAIVPRDRRAEAISLHVARRREPRGFDIDVRSSRCAGGAATLILQFEGIGADYPPMP